MKHVLKILPQYYCRVADGSKTFEYRYNDRGYQPGDIVILCETTDVGVRMQSKELEFKVGYVLQLPDSYCAFSLLPLNDSLEKIK
jgi:hypothetical protein